MKISIKQLNEIIKESIIRQINEAQVKIDNFDKLAKLMQFNTNDDFYFVQIIKRWKDNPDYAAKAQGQKDGTYHGGA